ncbi:TlpA disulfide reductase family protein [Palleronia sp. KMU-117]|uniref:TlpA disulfide reductase family protein n=1 Tax=Palleronia sp. KMU-117 TaxID=3434108 RepID=UPI003D714FE4
MKALKSAVLYTALALGANAAMADPSALAALRDGDMQKLIFHPEPQAVSQVAFADASGAEFTLADWQGKHVVVNFWATWCAPCRKEMPGLDRLQAEFGGDAFEVVTIATGRNSLTGIRKFFEETGVTNLPILLDPKSGLARDMGVLGLPITVVLDPEGREIARLIGDAEWDSDSAKAIVAALIDGKSAPALVGSDAP